MTVEEAGDDHTKDGTVDLQGNPVRRSIRGRWKACSFLVGKLYFQLIFTFIISFFLSKIIFFGTLFANTVLVYVQDNVGWGWGYGIPTLGLAISIFVFLLGTPFYRHKLPTGSPFMKMTRVIVTRKFTGNPRGITLLQRMGVGMIFHILLMTVACFTERYRLKVAADHGLVHQKGVKLPLSIFVLLPQFMLMGIADAFLEVAKLEFFYDQAPECMKSLGASYSLTSLGIGNFLSSFLLSTVSKITKKRGKGWILNNLNESRLDYYYLFFALLNFVNFLFFLVAVKFYVYRAEVTRPVDVKEEEANVMGVEENE
ncbi:hypothetical protein BRARA_I01915 [Brassica rapa]|uniref:Uncharacterized protein n=1 Tax=Brassica campestris TaxID=3711 RepID=A0A397Y2W7_BRACM|nr:hypothetical protein BRARA_I01915 [Brassica rapa]